VTAKSHIAITHRYKKEAENECAKESWCDSGGQSTLTKG
jgi:hypothetical protein